jgi:YD repeat-containing protein
VTRRLGIVSLLALLLTRIAAAEKPAAIELGFKPEKVYSFSALDNVNLFNGNLIFTVPIGQQYPVNGNLTYGLTLVYNSKAWDYFYVEAFSRRDDIRAWAKPNVRSNAGMGWRVSLGRLIPPAAFTATSGYAEVKSSYWTYEGPGGDEHTLDVRGSSATVSLSTDAEKDYLDNASIRMVVVNSNSRQIQFPNGNVHTFTYQRQSWRLTRMADAFDNYVDIAYTYDDTSDRTTAWTLTDPHGRTHTINFLNSPYLSETIDRGQIVSSIVMRGYGETTKDVTYTFHYESAASVAYGCEHNIPMGSTDFSPSPTTPRATVPLLTSISLPDGSSWTFTYSYDSVSGDCASGLLKDVTLPTLGKMSYTYQTYTIPANDWCVNDGPSNTSAGVKTRSIDEDGDKSGTAKTWTYLQTIGPVATAYDTSYQYTCGAPSPDGEQGSHYPRPGFRWKRTSVIAPPHNGTDRTRADHYFSIWRTRNFDVDSTLGADQRPLFEYGAPATAAWSGLENAKLAPTSFESAADVSAADDEDDDHARYLYEQTWTGCNAAGLCTTPVRSKYSRSAVFNGYRMTASDRTVFDDDTGCAGVECYSQSDWSDHDGAGHLRQVIRSGNFAGDTEGTEWTGYESWTLAAAHDPSRRWITGKYTEKKRTIGTRTSRTLFHMGDRGELLRTRALVDSTDESSNDVIESYSYSSAGNVTAIKTYGGDPAEQALPTDVELKNVDLADLTPQYRTDYSWTYGGLAYEQPSSPSTNVALTFRTRDYTRHADTGLVEESKDTAGLLTTYGYTPWGTLSSVKPPGELQTDYVYTPATTLAAAKVTMTRGDTTVVYEYDRMGRVAREERTVPGSGCVQRKISYDVFNRLTAETVWHRCTTSSAGSTTFGYDAFGRTLSVRMPDGKITSTSYTGTRLVKRSSEVAGATAEVAVATSEEYDVFGRLIEVKEDADDTGLTTTYSYDAGDRLTRVEMGAQARTFTYEGTGFLKSESHPESGTTDYTYDARGHVLSRKTPIQTTTFEYDAAERLRFVDVGGQRLKEFWYDAAAAAGRLDYSIRHNRHPAIGDVTVRETFTYHPDSGRIATKTTTVSTGQTFVDQYDYDALGALETIGYPSCSGCTGATAPVRAVKTVRTDGLATEITGYTNAITYHPTGMLNTLRHRNADGKDGAVYQQTSDFGMARPDEITVSGFCSDLAVTDPASRTAVKGSTTTLTVNATGATSIQWYERTSSGDVTVAGQTTATLTVIADVARTYFVRVGSGTCFLESAAATISVAACDTSAVAISAPSSVNAATEVTASISPVSGATYVWRVEDGGTVVNQTGTSAKILAGCGPAVTVAVTVTVGSCQREGSVTIPVVKATGTVSGSTTIDDGASASLRVALTGAGPWTIKWSDLVVEEVPASQSNHTRVVSPSLTTTYTLVSVTAAGGCTGTTSGSARVEVVPEAPHSLTATASSATSVALNWSYSGTADWFEIHRNGAYLRKVTASPALDTVVADTAYVYEVKAVRAGTRSLSGNRELATTVMFEDSPIVAGVQVIRAQHIVQLRTAINAVRRNAGLAVASFTDVIAPGVAVRAVYITEMRSALASARSALGLPALPYQRSTLAGQNVFAVDVMELRGGVQ